MASTIFSVRLAAKPPSLFLQRVTASQAAFGGFAASRTLKIVFVKSYTFFLAPVTRLRSRGLDDHLKV